MAVMPLRADAGRRIAITLACLVVWRLLAQIIPFDTNVAFVRQLFPGLQSDSGLLNLLVGHVPSTYSIVAVGIDPYVNMLVIATVVTLISKSVRDIARSPERSAELRRWVKAGAIALAFLAAYGYVRLNESDGLLPGSLDWFSSLAIILELTAGTVVLILLSEVIDQFGVGFGPFVIFAADRIYLDLQRVAFIVAGNPSADAIHVPIAIWAVSSLVAVTVTTTLVLARRTVTDPTPSGGEPNPAYTTNLLVSGVVRPPLLAFAVLSVPSIYARFLAVSHPDLAHQISILWYPLGPNLAIDVAYVVFSALLMVGFSLFVVFSDYGDKPRDARRRLVRLAVVGGIAIAVLSSVLPVIEEAATRAAGTYMPFSGAHIMLATVLVVLVTGNLARTPAVSGLETFRPQLP